MKSKALRSDTICKKTDSYESLNASSKNRIEGSNRVKQNNKSKLKSSKFTNGLYSFTKMTLRRDDRNNTIVISEQLPFFMRN